MKNILITGCNGQLGRALNDLYGGDSEVKLVNTDVSDLDITNLDMVLEKVKESKPDVIINCAAYTAVDKCEEEEEKAYQINAIGARNLSIAAKQEDAVMVHISTDYVFDGEKEAHTQRQMK